MSKVTEAEILEDINKLLFKLQEFKDVKHTSSDYGHYSVPSLEDISWDLEDEEMEEYATKDASGKWVVKPDAEYGEYTKVPLKETYPNFKLSTIKTLLKMLVNKDNLQDADHILAQYYNSNC